MKNEMILGIVLLAIAFLLTVWQASKIVNEPCPQGTIKVQVRTMQGPASACIPSSR